ncbi:MAG: HDIG domain-containing protein [Armatimonadetes bacterium]|nr:HDIG domain-containing protein [Armatimonadota bacterium]
MRQAGFRPQMILLGLGTALALSLLLGIDLPVRTVSLKTGDIASEAIKAPRSAYYIDRTATEERRRRAESMVVPFYDVDLGVVNEAKSRINTTFQNLREFISRKGPLNYEEIRSKLPFRLSDPLILSAAGARPEDLDKAEKETVAVVVNKVFSPGIRSNTSEIQAAHETIRRLLGGSSLPDPMKELATQVALKVVYTPNWIYNEQETERLLREKRSQVEPVRSRIEAGETIVDRGQAVSQSEIDKLVALGLQSPHFNARRASSLFLLAVFFVVVIGLYMRQYAPHVGDNDRLLGLLSLVVFLALLAYKIASRSPDLEYLAVPICATTGMVVTIMLDGRFAVMVAMMISVLTATLSGNEFALCVMSLGSSLIGIYCVSDLHSRAQLIRTGFILGAANVVLSATLGALTGHETTDILAEMSWGLISGILCAVLTFGLVMFLERPFGVTTHLRLLELSDPNEPILKRLQMEAPGTCTHCIMVANLAESAAKAIGADALLTRVASYYHDIGKLKRPYCFAENQFSTENIHDRLSPNLSTLAIIAHVKEGIEMARELKLPQAIIDIIPQHHGTNLVSYFYNRALEHQGEGEVPETGFRYPGPKPQTREAAVIMLADGVEAAARSLANPTQARIEAMIHKIITERLDDGQLSECDLTLRNLEVMERTFVHMLKGLMHTRVEYPDQERDIPAIYLEPSRARKKGEIADAHSGVNPRPEKGINKDTADTTHHLRRISGRRR